MLPHLQLTCITVSKVTGALLAHDLSTHPTVVPTSPQTKPIATELTVLRIFVIHPLHTAALYICVPRPCSGWGQPVT